jgi:hypothetical protein
MLHNVLWQGSCLHVLAGCYAVLSVDYEELTSGNLLPGFGLLIRVWYDTQCLLGGVWHVLKVVLCIQHALFFIFIESPIFRSSFHLFNGDFVLCVYIPYKALLALCLELFVHCLSLQVVRFSIRFKI